MNSFYKKGFTLIEMLVAVGIFSILTVSLSSVFVSSIKSQTHTLYTQELMNQSSRVLEYMGRALRMAKKDTSGTCIAVNTSYNYDAVNHRITFLDYNDKCHRFLLSSDTIREQESTDATVGNLQSAVDLTSSTIEVNALTFNVTGDGQPPADTNQPKVTILIDAQGSTEAIDPIPTIKVQTTVSQRHLDVEE